MVHSSLKAVISSIFSVGGPTGNAIKAETYGLSVRDYLGSTLQRLGIGRAVNPTDAASYLDAQEKAILVQFSFNGSAPPVAGINSGNYGFCHTSGGSFTAGAIYLDNGSSLVAVTSYKGQLLLTVSAVTGTVSLVANGLYIAQANVAPFSWTLKGDGAPSQAGFEQSIQLTIGTASSYGSTTAVPSGAYVTSVLFDVQTGFSNGTAVSVQINGGTPLIVMQSTENTPTSVEIYEKSQHQLVGASNAGTLLVNVAGGPVAGAGFVTVKFISTYLA